MDHNSDSQKQPLLDGVSCSGCRDLVEHRNKNCSLPLLILTTDTGDTTDVAIDNYGEPYGIIESQSFRCEDCFLSFMGSRTLEDHLTKKCIKIPVARTSPSASYESCMDELKIAMHEEHLAFNAIKAARSDANQDLLRYSRAAQRTTSAHETYMEAVEREKHLHTIVSIEEQSIMSDIVLQNRNTVKAFMKKETVEAKAVYQALFKLRYYVDLATFKASTVHFAHSEALKAFKRRRFTATSAEAGEQELQKIRSILEKRHTLLTELIGSVDELQANISAVKSPGLGREKLKESKNDGTSTSSTATNDSQTDQVDTTVENLDNSRASTSGTTSGSASDVHVPPSNSTN